MCGLQMARNKDDESDQLQANQDYKAGQGGLLPIFTLYMILSATEAYTVLLKLTLYISGSVARTDVWASYGQE